jgi:exopolyphosphatase/guanosine-5'-triphosphate,3'-diphosphate pyrophosphatase
VWDLGSSSFQVLVCEHHGCRRLEPVVRRRALLNLGIPVGASGVIPPERVSAALAAVKRLRRALAEAEPDVVVALATAALRDAANGADVVARIERLLGTPVRILDGEEEARLCFVGQRAGVFTGQGPTLGLDLGGGSFEVAVGDDRRITLATSAPVGATRLRGELGAGDVLGRPGVAAVRRRTAQAMGNVAGALRKYPGVARRTVLSGGTARALARLATAHTRGDGAGAGAGAAVNQVELPAAQVEQQAALLAGLTLRQRLALPGMPARRAAMVPVGAAILCAIAEVLGVERFVVSEWGLHEGALLDALGEG